MYKVTARKKNTAVLTMTPGCLVKQTNPEVELLWPHKTHKQDHDITFDPDLREGEDLRYASQF